MSKRRNRNKAPNIPSETLERARRQAGLEAETEVDDSVEEVDLPAIVPGEVEILPPEEPAAKPKRPAEAQKPKRRRQQDAPQVRLKKKSGSEDYSSEQVAEILANPTKFVTEDEMREQYSYVLADLRNMGILAAALLIALIVIAQFV